MKNETKRCIHVPLLKSGGGIRIHREIPIPHVTLTNCVAPAAADEYVDGGGCLFVFFCPS